MMTSNEYYNRKTEMDFIEEEIRSRKGCQNLFRIIVFVAVATALVSFGLKSLIS